MQENTVECLDPGAWIIVHCGQMRNQKTSSRELCDIPFEVKKILDAIDGVTLQVSSFTLLPRLFSAVPWLCCSVLLWRLCLMV